MSEVVRGRPWADVAAELRRLTMPADRAAGPLAEPLAELAERLGDSPYAAGVYGAASLGASGVPILRLAQTPWFDPERGAVSAAAEDGRLVLRYHAAPGEAAVIPADGPPFEALERFFLERRWFTSAEHR